MLSVILLSYYSNNKIELVYNKISKALNDEKISFEFIIIDDGSNDNSYEIGNKLATNFENVKSYKLSKNFTSHYAAFAGLSVSKGDCATIIPDDEQQPYESIIRMYRIWQQGNKIIIPYRENRDDKLFSKYTSILFYKLMNTFSEIKFPPGGSDSFLIDREIIDLINYKIHPINTTTITEILRLGFDPHFMAYQRPKGDNKKSRWTLKKKINLAKDFFFSSSTFPIKLITFLGLFFSIFSFVIIIIYAYARLIGNDNFWKLSEVPGWTSTVIIISFFSGLILFSLGITAEYIWRIFEEVKNRPGYIIKKK
ncbi:MAG: glycosyltransferase [Chitinophagaceae bacterium]|nr:glycosyltransferase [Chitinophagaceae bacterium]